MVRLKGWWAYNKIVGFFQQPWRVWDVKEAIRRSIIKRRAEEMDTKMTFDIIYRKFKMQIYYSIEIIKTIYIRVNEIHVLLAFFV